MPTVSYPRRRSEIEEYFDRTALEGWKKLTSEAPVSGIRATVRAGRARMQAQLSGWLPEDLTGRTVLDAGCGAGGLALALAARGAQVLAVDLSPSMVEIGRERILEENPEAAQRVEFAAGDVLEQSEGRQFDHVVAMDSLIHYEREDAIAMLLALAERTHRSIAFTFAPRTPLLALMHLAGGLFPRADRAPAIVPVSPTELFDGLADRVGGYEVRATERVATGFYTSQAVNFVRSGSDG